MIYDGQSNIVGATCCQAFVREKVCSIHGDTARVGFGRMSITIACVLVSRIVESLCCARLSNGLNRPSLPLKSHALVSSLFRSTDTLPFGGNNKLRCHSQTRSILSWRSSFKNSPSNDIPLLFFKTIPALESFFFFLNLPLQNYKIRYFEFVLNS